MTTDAELVALLVRADWTGLSLSAKASWRRDFAALQREVPVRVAHRGGTSPPRSRPHTPRLVRHAAPDDLDRIEAAALAGLRGPRLRERKPGNLWRGMAQTSFLSQVREVLVPGL
jgi:hypothetical protein